MMTFKTLSALSLAAVLALAGSNTVALSQQAQLKPIGTITFDPQPVVQTDSFKISDQDTRLKAFRILMEKGSAEVRVLKVTYDNGTSEQLTVKQVLREGERSSVIEFREVRRVKSIQVNYVPRGTVKMVLLAETRAAQDWAELACKNVGFLVDRDVANVSTEDTYKSLRLRSANHEIDMIQLTVRYANGARDTYDIRTKIPAGGRIGPIDLRGERRRIAQLEFIYRTKTIGTVKTQLCVDGLK